MGAEVDIEAELTALAARQYGVVARRQLLRMGLGEKAIAYRVRRGRLIVLHRGVYALGHRVLRAEGHWLAAVLACGDRAVLSGVSAAAAWDLRPAVTGRIDVTVRSATGRRPQAGVRLHRRAGLRDDETTVHRAIPITTPARTVLDLAATASPRAIERLLDQAEAQARIEIEALDEVLARHHGRPGTRTLLAALSLHRAGTPMTRSELEAAFLDLCDRHGLPRPRTNARVGTAEVDALWPADRVVVELDGWSFHRSRAAFERDRARDQRLLAAGFRVLRVTHRQLATAPDAVARTLRGLLGCGGP